MWKLAPIVIAVIAGAARADELPPPAWPQEIIARPFTLNAGMIDAHVAGELLALKTGMDAMGNPTYSTGESLALGVAFGVSNQLQLGVDYAAPVHPNFHAGDGTLGAGAAFRFAHSETISGALAAQFVYLRQTVAGITTDSEAIDVGIAFRYRFVDSLSVFTPGPQLAIGLNKPQPISATIPVGVELQASSSLYLQVATNLAKIGIKDYSGSNQYIISDFIPVTAGVYFSPSNQLDIGVVASDDLKHASDAYALLATLRFFKI
jgi:hypothetical protein